MGEDLQMETGEYFLNEQERLKKKDMETRERQKAKTALKKLDRAKAYEPPAPLKKRKVESASGVSQEGQKERFRSSSVKLVRGARTSRLRSPRRRALLVHLRQIAG